MSQSCVSCKFLQVRTFNSSLSPRQLSDGVPEDQEHNGNPNARYVYKYYAGYQKFNCGVSRFIV